MSKPRKLPLAERKRRALQAATSAIWPLSTLTEVDLAWIEQRLGLDQRIEAAIARRLGAINKRGGCG